MHGEKLPVYGGVNGRIGVGGGRLASVDRSALGVLTPRELEVFSVLPDGEGNRELARRLGIAERTVKAHLTSITRKLGLRSRVEAALLSAEWSHDLRLDPKGIHRP
ncbi:helix-turn-helix transcriptional regulator [Streptomyces sp. NBC_01485]|uniref:helix-turn-helix domain-containing protein n=1 Tax=Streptomyces sp. NBC_01485 TaxID=2903884 RepID=UPI002E37606E|nr:helix-turn-helix transcriptional regulator [Streptomyces sp. NBC_01485]